MYEEISLIAEIGGFVGLFLGATVYQTADLIDSMITRVSKFFPNKSVFVLGAALNF